MNEWINDNDDADNNRMLGERVEEKTAWYIAMCQLELLVILFLNEEKQRVCSGDDARPHIKRIICQKLFTFCIPTSIETYTMGALFI